MKKLLLSIALLALAAGAAQAYTKTSPAPTGSASATPAGPSLGGSTVSADEPDVVGPGYQMGGNIDVRRRKNPTRPVPEPGTMALASMGLLALGAAARKRRARG